ncbi:MAG: hypothetical protein EZS28_026255 [Streblomastix strix]|uniref:Uncharacterized protein n=1 Tax=Streblomastix strix TaxID=222440 RepID=A0A5J4V672_9EUKA|nr:MAG: hypothetical protein EZS28_026255 [Streblomastix strix]
MNCPTIPEIKPQFEKEIDPFQQQVIRCETSTLSARRRSSIFEETLTPDPSVCRWLLDIISEDEHMIKESAHFVLSENQLIRVVAYTFDVPESQIQLSIENEGCCGRFCSDSTKTLNEILIGNVNILKLDVEKENDALLLLKADKSELIDIYSKTEADAFLEEKLNISDQIDAYTKQEDDALLLLKIDKSELADYVDLASNQKITGQKQFGIITVSSISKQNKNDASILLAGGGDMLVSSLVSQPQLQEVRDIASVDKQVMDYWWDGSSLRALETELTDMSNVVTILGAATGGGNAIIYLSFDGNILISAKNSSFITTNYDETITDQKTFNTTIHSVGISVQNYDNNSVVCAGGGVKSIQNINASVDFSNYYNKSQTYSQTETDQKLNLKLNISDQIDAYTKTQDDALLLLKADKTELIDSFNKTEINALLDDKLNVSDQIDAYIKTQHDALQLLKAGKTQLIDAYTKIETNNLQMTMPIQEFHTLMEKMMLCCC